MTFTFDYGTDASFGFTEHLDLLASGVFGGSISQLSATTYTITNDGKTFTFSGTGFVFATLAGQTLLSGGIIDSISVSQGGTDLGSLNDLNMPSATLSFAFLDEFFGTDPLALENLFLTEDWIFIGNNDAQVLTADMLTDDGFSYSPSGNDTAFLMGGDDIFDLGLGNDTIFGGTGRDQLFGGAGDDILNGGGAKDIIHGGAGNDIMHGGSDDNIMHGESGRDIMYGDGGDDIMFGGTGGGTDSMYGGEGNDQLNGGNQRDKLWGGAGDDTLNGDLGNDIMFGGDGEDILNGGTGNDRMFGGAGDNVFNGGTGDDRMYAGDDADTFVFNSITNTGDDDVYGYDTAEDTLDINGTSFLGINIFADHVVVSHSGGTITLNDLTISNIAEYNAMINSFDTSFDDPFAVG